MPETKKRWIVIVDAPTPVPSQKTIEVSALACEVQNGALLFWDGGLTKAFGSGAWVECTEVAGA